MMGTFDWYGDMLCSVQERVQSLEGEVEQMRHNEQQMMRQLFEVRQLSLQREYAHRGRILQLECKVEKLQKEIQQMQERPYLCPAPRPIAAPPAGPPAAAAFAKHHQKKIIGFMEAEDDKAESEEGKSYKEGRSESYEEAEYVEGMGTDELRPPPPPNRPPPSTESIKGYVASEQRKAILAYVGSLSPRAAAEFVSSWASDSMDSMEANEAPHNDVANSIHARACEALKTVEAVNVSEEGKGKSCDESTGKSYDEDWEIWLEEMGQSLVHWYWQGGDDLDWSVVKDIFSKKYDTKGKSYKKGKGKSWVDAGKGKIFVEDKGCDEGKGKIFVKDNKGKGKNCDEGSGKGLKVKCAFPKPGYQ